MDEKKLVLLLQIIDSNGNIRKMIHEGVTYMEISSLIEKAIEMELLIYKNEKILLSEKGKSFLFAGQEIIKKRNKTEWIQIEKKSLIPKLNKNEIYLPNQNELWF